MRRVHDARASSHSWEAPAHSWEAPEDPANEDSVAGWGGEWSGSDAPTETPPAASEFVSHMMSLLTAGTLNCQQVCVAMHWAWKAGVEEARPYAFPPGRSSGHYSRHLQAFMGSSEERSRLYTLDTPGHAKADMCRTTHQTSVIPPHEAIAETMEDADYLRRVREFLANNTMAPAYEDHVVVTTAKREEPDAPVVPLCLYMDAVPYSQLDSVLGAWLECMATGHRWLCAVLRKRRICRCGCRGWCSYNPLFAFLNWSVLALSQGMWPDGRHDGQQWRPSDDRRRERPNERMPTRGAIVHIKGDWSEYAHTFGLPMWSDGLRPCYECAASGSDMYVAHGNSVLGLRWPCNTDDDYDRACDRCEVVVRLTGATKALVLECLRYDKRDSGAHGRALSRDIEALGLRANDRLEPSAVLPDVSKLADLETPATVVFWRCSEETLTRHRNPLFKDSAVTGLRFTSLTTDLLHALYLGVMNRYCAVALWHVLDSNIFGAAGTAEENLQVAVLLLKAQLMDFYKEHHRQHPTKPLTRISDLTVKMVGTRNDPRCKTKGAETFGMTVFLTGLLLKYAALLGADGKRLQRAGSALLRMVEIWAESGHVMDQAARQESGLTGTKSVA